MMSRLNRWDIAFLVCVIAVFLFFFRSFPSDAVFYYDEADYMKASASGFVNNALERPSMSLPTFLKFGFERGLDSARRTELSQFVRNSGDINFFRHYHGPLYFYYLSSVIPAVNGNEYLARLSGFLFHVLTFVAVYCGVLLLADPAPRIAAGIASFLVLFGSSNMGTAAMITPHNSYYLTTTIALLAFAGFLRTGRLGWWYASVAAVALSVCSIEYSVLIPVTFAICLWRKPEASLITRRVLLRSVLLFLGILVVVWPVGVLGLSALKSYFFFAHAIFKKTGNYGGDTFATSWMKRMALSPPEYAIDIACAIAAIVFFRRLRSRNLVLPCLVYTGLLFLTTIKNRLLTPTYTASIMPALAIVSGVVLAQFLSRWNVRRAAAAAALIMLLLALDGTRQLRAQQQRNREAKGPVEALLAHIRKSGHDRDKALVPFELLPTLAYYYPGMRLTPYLPADGSQVLLAKLSQGGYNSFIYLDHFSGDMMLSSQDRLHDPDRIGVIPELGRLTFFRRVAF